MLAWVLNVNFAGSGVPDVPSAPSIAPERRTGRSQPSGWVDRWRVAWVILRPSLGWA